MRRLFDLGFRTTRLESGDLGARNNVRLEVVVDVGGVATVGGLDVTGDLDGRGWVARASTGDLDLRARDVELWGRSGVVDAELLNAEQVLSSSDLRWDGDGVGACLMLVTMPYVHSMENPYLTCPRRPGRWRSWDRSP